MKALKGLVIAATSSNGGKTSASIALICALKRFGIPVLSAKCGPDFIDPSWLGWACGKPVANIDLHMTGREGHKRLQERLKAELGSHGALIVEGAMGLYDGDRQGRASTAEIAAIMQLPILLLLNAKGMGQSLAAVAEGFLNYQASWQKETGACKFLGLICTHSGSDAHAALCRSILEPVVKKFNIPFLGCLSGRNAPQIPSRHLGLIRANEVSLNKDELADWFISQIDMPCLLENLELAKTGSSPYRDRASHATAHEFFPALSAPDSRCVDVAIARDEAFSFIYADLPALLQEAGARVEFFSPLHDPELPECDGIYLPGGYPELYAERLSGNLPMLAAIRRKAESGTPIYGECGGYIYLGHSLKDGKGQLWKMCDLLPVKFELEKKLQGLGYRQVRAFTQVSGGPVICKGHEFHYARIVDASEDIKPLWRYMKEESGRVEGTCSRNNVFGSWIHLYPEGSRDFWKYWLNLCLESKGERA